MTNAAVCRVSPVVWCARVLVTALIAVMPGIGTASADPVKAALIKQSIPIADGWSTLSFTAPSFDTGAFWSSSQPARFTVPAGVQYVQVAAFADFDNGCTVCNVYVLQNGGVVAQAYGATANVDFGEAGFTAIAPIVRVQPGDVFTVVTYRSPGGNGTARPVTFSILALDGRAAVGGGGITAAALSQVITVQTGWGPVLQFGTPQVDTGGIWNAGAPSVFTVPAGINRVQVAASISLPYTCTVCEIYIGRTTVAGSADVVAVSYGATANTGFGGATFTAFNAAVPVSPGDTFWVGVYQNDVTQTAPVQFSLVALDGPLVPAGGGVRSTYAKQNLSIPTAWSPPLAFAAPSVDENGAWSSSQPNVYRVPAGATHAQVMVSVGFDYYCTVCLAYLVKNNTETIGMSYGATANTGFGGATFTAVASLVAVQPGDFFTVGTFQNTGAPVNAVVQFSLVTFGNGSGFGDVHLTSNLPSGQVAGTPIVWTAAASNGTPPYQYKWWLSSDAGASWSTLRDWNTSSTYTWTPTTPNDQYVVAIWARDATMTADVGDFYDWKAFAIAANTGGGGGGGDTGGDDPPPLPAPENVVVEYFHTDALGSVRLVTGQDQHVLAAYDYLPFGGNALGTADDQNSRRFTGQEREATTGSGSSWQPLEYFGARYYQPQVGRFAQVDAYLDIAAALTAPQHWDRYAYVLNNPLRFTDPLGLFEWARDLGGDCTDKDLSSGLCEGVTKTQGRAIVDSRIAIRDAIQKLASSGDRDLARAGKAFGREGDKNGVFLGLYNEGGQVGSRVISPNPLELNSGGNPVVKVELAGQGPSLFINAAHEGFHVADAQAVAHGAPAMSHYLVELRGYWESILAARQLGMVSLQLGTGDKAEIWRRGWSNAQTLKAIDAYLRASPIYGPKLTDPAYRLQK